ncbi:MAG: hypothetical protein HY681_02960 [Chloroflexi bacterium]|nr:hypothetical protein [Chloroflexota bacterium]
MAVARFTGLFLMVLLAGCSTSGAALPTPTPMFAPGEAAALVRRVIPESTNSYCDILKHSPSVSWQEEYVPPGAWRVRVDVNSKGLEGALVFLVYERTQTVTQVENNLQHSWKAEGWCMMPNR